MSVQPGGKPILVDLQALEDAYYAGRPDPTEPAQRVAFGTSGHRGSSLSSSFNEAHIVATTAAIVGSLLAGFVLLRLVGVWGSVRLIVAVYLLMALRRPDVWPAGDLALAKALQAVKKLPVKPGEDVMRTIARPWRPFRAVAARMLWQEYLCRNRAASAASG